MLWKLVFWVWKDLFKGWREEMRFWRWVVWFLDGDGVGVGEVEVGGSFLRLVVWVLMLWWNIFVGLLMLLFVLFFVVIDFLFVGRGGIMDMVFLSWEMRVFRCWEVVVWKLRWVLVRDLCMGWRRYCEVLCKSVVRLVKEERVVMRVVVVMSGGGWGVWVRNLGYVMIGGWLVVDRVVVEVDGDGEEEEKDVEEVVEVVEEVVED